MDKLHLKKLVEENNSTRQIAKIEKCSQSTVKYWLKKYDLKTTPVRPKLSKEERSRRNVERVTNKRRQLKEKAVDYKGGKCCKCDYSKCIGALEFHHTDPNEKDFSMSVQGYTRSWEKIKKELDKCILVCANCHREIHSGEA